jgi:hypothetical protein
MEHRKQHLPLIVVAVGLLSLGSGCLTPDAAKTGAKKPDVTQPGVLPPPQEMMKPASAMAPAGGVVPAGGVQPQPGVQPVAAGAPAPSPLAKLIAKTEKKVPATEIAVTWRNRIGYLPDPTKNGAVGAGLVGQLFLFGGQNLQFVVADGTLTVDLVDETPRPPGQAAATPERWQIDKNTLRNLRTMDETFGQSYVLFLPWPAYRADITRVKISARYDPEHGHTLFMPPSVVSIDTSGPLGAQVFDGMSNTIKPIGGLSPSGPVPFTGLPPTGATPNVPMNPIPLGGGSRDGAKPPTGGAIPLNPPTPVSAMPLVGAPSGFMPLPAAAPMMPLPPGATPTATAPSGAMPAGPLPPLGITLPSR